MAVKSPEIVSYSSDILRATFLHDQLAMMLDSSDQDMLMLRDDVSKECFALERLHPYTFRSKQRVSFPHEQANQTPDPVIYFEYQAVGKSFLTDTAYGLKLPRVVIGSDGNLHRFNIGIFIPPNGSCLTYLYSTNLSLRTGNAGKPLDEVLTRLGYENLETIGFVPDENYRETRNSTNADYERFFHYASPLLNRTLERVI